MPQDGVAETLGREGRGKPSTCVSATQLVGGRDLASGSMGRLQKRWKRVIPRTVSCPSTFALSTFAVGRLSTRELRHTQGPAKSGSRV